MAERYGHTVCELLACRDLTVAAPREPDVAVAGRDQGVRGSSDSPLEGDVVRGFCQTPAVALQSGEQVIGSGRNGVSQAEAQAALNEVRAIINNVKFR